MKVSSAAGREISSEKSWGKRGLFQAALILTLVPLFIGCNHEAAKNPEKRTPEVIVSKPIVTEVADYQDFTGRLDGLKMVEIRARVTGFILTAPFKEGDLVHEGDRLFTIDPQTYKADFDLAAANLKLAKADLNLQQKTTARARVLVRQSAMAQEDYDTAVATAEKSQATIEAMAATKERAKMYVDYTLVNAPLTGRISRRFVDPGNLVNADNTVLTTIVGDDQLYAYFDVDERSYLNLIGGATLGKTTLANQLQFPALLRLANEEEFTRTGVVNFVDNRVNANTGTIRMRAVFANPGGLLRAGLFVRIRLPIGAPYQALVIPDEAVLSDQGRKYVYIDNENDEVAYKTVTLGQEMKGQRVIKTGLNKDDRVIVDGLQRIRPGVRVTAEVRPPAKPPESPLSKLLNSENKGAAPVDTKKPAKPEPAEAPGTVKKAEAKASGSQTDRAK
ncbi:MAG TPA: efflux RND transporter periplasmic adaptor subunit [Gemmataceae bacterium]|nr:efflux RND transporter periplasmic adaptor subunit [Gemmataceae bacterium]